MHPNTDHILIGRYRELVDEAVGFINIILEVSEIFHDRTISLIYVRKEVTKPLEYSRNQGSTIQIANNI